MPTLVRAVALLVPMLLASAAGAQEATLVPVTVDGERVRLEMRIYRPATADPAPTLVFNHGSTGRGTDPRRFTRPIDYPALAQFFVERGWAVVMPARRGRGGSEGLYDEGFERNRAKGYACDQTISLEGAGRALRDVEAAMDAILAMAFVDGRRVVVGGQSRGGILSVYASAANQALFARGGRYGGDTLWLYGDGDTFYSLDHSRANFAAFQAGRGKGTFHEFPKSAGGHGIQASPQNWAVIVESYLKRQGLPSAKREPGVSR